MRFVILTHDWPTPHWDLLLERECVLKAWRLLAEPDSGGEIAATRNFDHRLFYLDYEGPISDGRGTVTRWDYGTMAWLEIEEDACSLELHGNRLIGQFMLSSRAANEESSWVFAPLRPSRPSPAAPAP